MFGWILIAFLAVFGLIRAVWLRLIRRKSGHLG